MMVLHVQKVAGISGSEAHLLSLLPRLRERGWDIRMLMLHENEPGAWDFARALGQLLHDRVAAEHSVQHWADGVMDAVRR